VTALLKYWPILLFVTNLLLVWVCWSLRQLANNEVQTRVANATGPILSAAEKLAERVDGHHDKIAAHGAQIDEIRSDIRDLPTKTDLSDLRGEVRVVGGEVQAANAGIKRIEGYFLERGVRSQS